jgi:pimeloyl-ACP methyl ester carboxylesterase
MGIDAAHNAGHDTGPATARIPVTTVHDGRKVTGVSTPPGRTDRPLLVCLPGGSYNARYFDVPGASFLDAASANGFSAIALDRPGYSGSDPVPDGEPVFAANAAVLNGVIGALWAEHGGERPGVVIISHSIGSAVAVHLAGLAPLWPLLGISLHGINDFCPEPVVNAWNSMPAGQPVVFTPEQRRMFMYGPDTTVPADAVDRAEVAAAPMPIAELLEVVREWPRDAAQLAAAVPVPVQYALAEHEGLWVSGQDRVDAFAGYFTSAPRVEARLFRGSGHNIDHHHLGPVLHLQQLAFALSCTPAAAAALA